METLEEKPSEDVPGSHFNSIIYHDGNGFYYYATRVRGKKRYLRCVHHRKGRCPANSLMKTDPGAPIKTKDVVHNHRPLSPLEQERKMAEAIASISMKKRAQSENTPLKDIYYEEFVRFADLLPDFTLRNATRRMRRKRHLFEQPEPPENLLRFGEIMFLPKWQKILNRVVNRKKIKFLQEVQISSDGVSLIYSNLPFLNILIPLRHTIRTVVFDSTSKVIPQLEDCSKLFTFHIIYKNAMYPLVYALLSKETESTYSRIFEYIAMKLQLDWGNITIITDFKQAPRNAMAKLFPGARVLGAHFHFVTSIVRYVYMEDLIDFVRSNQEASLTVKMISALPLLPPNGPNSVINGIAVVRQFMKLKGVENLEPLVSYIEDYWLSRMTPGSMALYGTAPRTNNFIASFRTQLFYLFGMNSPAWDFYGNMRRLESKSRKELEAALGGLKVKHPVDKMKFVNNCNARAAVTALLAGHNTMHQFLCRAACLMSNIVDWYLDEDIENEPEDSCDELCVEEETDIEPGNCVDKPANLLSVSGVIGHFMDQSTPCDENSCDKLFLEEETDFEVGKCVSKPANLPSVSGVIGDFMDQSTLCDEIQESDQSPTDVTVLQPAPSMQIKHSGSNPKNQYLQISWAEPDDDTTYVLLVG